MGFAHSKVDADTMKLELYEMDSTGQLAEYPNFTMEFKRQKEVEKKDEGKPKGKEEAGA